MSVRSWLVTADVYHTVPGVVDDELAFQLGMTLKIDSDDDLAAEAPDVVAWRVRSQVCERVWEHQRAYNAKLTEITTIAVTNVEPSEDIEYIDEQ